METPASACNGEAIRKAALYFGWMVRHSSNGPSIMDAQREAAMRAAVAAAPKHSAAVVGSFHAAALLPEPLLWSAPEPAATATETGTPPVTSLIPYSFEQLEERSGYPAGVMDPVWHQAMLGATDPAAAHRLVADLAVELCRHLRNEGHVAGTPDAIEIVRLARDLSRLRGLPAPGRGELLEAIETSLVQGDLFGRGRAVAAAAQAVLVGKQRGRLPKGTPRSGLAVQIDAAVERLKLPGPGAIDEELRELRLDPARSRLDRGRAVFFRRLSLLGIPYAKRLDAEAIGNRENLTEAWEARWTGATTASVEATGIHGVTLVQASEAAVGRLRQADTADQGDEKAEHQHPATILARLVASAECGLGNAVKKLLAQLDGPFLQNASAAQLIEAAAVMQRIAAGHFAGLPLRDDEVAMPDVELFEAPAALLDAEPLLDAAVRGLDGLRGSDEPADVAALVDLTAIIRGSAERVAEKSPLLPALRSFLLRLEREGSPRMQGAAWGALAMLAEVGAEKLGAILASWYDGASTSEGRGHLRSRLQGLLVPLLPLVCSDPNWLLGLESQLASSGDNEFLARLPALRGGFDALTPADRARLLSDRLAVLEPHGPAARHAQVINDPESFAAASAADRSGRAVIARLLPDFVLREPSKGDADVVMVRVSDPPGEITLADRWRLVLGVKGCGGARGKLAALGAGSTVRRQCAAQAAVKKTTLPAGGNGGCVAVGAGMDQGVKRSVRGRGLRGGHGRCGRCGTLRGPRDLNPETVRPSVNLLEQVLALRRALPERELALLRKLARRITQRLAEQLANRLRPALSGLSTPRPTQRSGGRLDLARTVEANLDTAYRRGDGRIAVAPKRILFSTPAKRQMDWHLIFVVDVSGSMEASVIDTALVAAIFSALPAIDVKFFAFSTEVIDFSNSVDDPLSLLMEVRVGGGTHIGLGLRGTRGDQEPGADAGGAGHGLRGGYVDPGNAGRDPDAGGLCAKLLGLAALDDDAKPRYHTGVAAGAVSAGMPVAAVSPERLAQWVGDQIRGARS